jgi:hypothetical protein
VSQSVRSPCEIQTKSKAALATALAGRGHRVAPNTVGRLLRDLGYSLQANRKDKEGRAPPERDAQFRYLNAQVRAFLDRGQPVLSVDTKKKELVGEFKNGGREWQPKGAPMLALTHDFPDTADAYSGQGEHSFQAKPSSRSGHGEQSERQRRWGGGHFACLRPLVKFTSTLRMESPASFSRWALCTSRSRMASASVASPITACQSLGSSWLVTTVELTW